ncbi:hypothetical protein AcW2_007271 [Taiwanofungus camphoratus]|nr:hypothetical protein AcW2_007271 [Antrodia cinnamomea]
MAPKDKDAILKQFREQLAQQDLLLDGDTIGTDDATLLRFLRARHFDLKAATAMWSDCQHWRKTVEGVGIDELYRQLDPFDYPEREKVFECWPLWFHKTDKKGRPLNIHHFGGINMPELHKHISPERFWQTIVVNAESLTREVLPATTLAAGKSIGGTFVIVDLKGFGIGQFWQMKGLARDSFQISQDYFPETMAQLAIINAPASFTTIWSFVRPCLAKETVAKVDILGSDYEQVLLAQIDAENLPTSLGGTCTCEALGGCSKSNTGPWMVGRKERREKWLRGERTKLELGPEDGEGEKLRLQQNMGPQGMGSALSQDREDEHADTTDKEDLAQEEQASRGESPKEGDAEGEEKRAIEVETTSPGTSPDSTSGPSTPAEESDVEEKVQEGADQQGQLHRKKSKEDSIHEVYEKHPETREPQTGDLHKDIKVSDT